MMITPTTPKQKLKKVHLTLNMISNYHTGIENLHNSNPGDNLLDDDEIDYEIFEIDD